MKRKFVYIAGAGPGNIEYMTVKVKRLLQKCDVIIYDSLVDIEALELCRTDAEIIYAGKRAGHHSMKQDEISRLIVQKAMEGNTVLRLKGGDPFVFGRGPEECEELKKNGIPYEVVPGITSAVAVPMAAGIPVTNRNMARSFTVITGHTASGELQDEIDFEALAHTSGTLVFLMGLGAIGNITDSLIRSGMDENIPAAVISNGTMLNQYVLRGTLGTITDRCKADSNVISPAIIVVGKVSELDLNSDVRDGLEGINIIACGTMDFCKREEELMQEHGARVTKLPVLQIKEIEQEHKVDKMVSGIINREYRAIAFTGRNAIRIFMERLNKSGVDIRSLYNIDILAIGSGTASYLKEYGINADGIPDEYTSDGLARLIIQRANASKKDEYVIGNKVDSSSRYNVLIPRASKGNDVLASKLQKAGVSFDEIALYDTIANDHISEQIERVCLMDGVYDYITFASAEGVRLFMQNGGVIPKGVRAVCIGKYTQKALTEAGVYDCIVAQKATAEGIVEAILADHNRYG